MRAPRDQTAERSPSTPSDVCLTTHRLLGPERNPFAFASAQTSRGTLTNASGFTFAAFDAGTSRQNIPVAHRRKPASHRQPTSQLYDRTVPKQSVGRLPRVNFTEHATLTDNRPRTRTAERSPSTPSDVCLPATRRLHGARALQPCDQTAERSPSKPSDVCLATRRPPGTGGDSIRLRVGRKHGLPTTL